ncbi:hypothetical protein JCM9743_01410 [Natrinema sp. JCM 9743]
MSVLILVSRSLATLSAFLFPLGTSLLAFAPLVATDLGLSLLVLTAVLLAAPLRSRPSLALRSGLSSVLLAVPTALHPLLAALRSLRAAFGSLHAALLPTAPVFLPLTLSVALAALFALPPLLSGFAAVRAGRSVHRVRFDPAALLPGPCPSFALLLGALLVALTALTALLGAP